MFSSPPLPRYKSTPNPIMQAGGDFSTAWQTKAGEWRATSQSGLFSSMDFESWTRYDPIFDGSECTDFYPLPRTCDGCHDAAAAAVTVAAPTHVLKRSDHTCDQYMFGVYDEGALNGTGTWKNTTDWSSTDRLIDYYYQSTENSAVYASKSFVDSKNNRRINLGWLRSHGAMTLAREVTYNPTHGLLQFPVIPEIAKVRNATLVASVPAGTTDSFFGGGWPAGGLQIEALASFTHDSSGTAVSADTPDTPPPEFGLCLAVPASNQTSCPIRVGVAVMAGGAAVKVTVTGADGGVGVAVMPIAANEAIEVRAYVDQQFAEVDLNQVRLRLGGRIGPSVACYDHIVVPTTFQARQRPLGMLAQHTTPLHHSP